MAFKAFLLIMASAILHSFWNLLVKRGHHKIVFTWWMFLWLTLILIPIFLLFFPDQLIPSIATLVAAMITGFCFALFQNLGGLAYEKEDLSLTYPLTMTGSLYVPIWAFIFLNELTSWEGILGIFLIFIGSYIIPFKSFKSQEILKPFSQFRNKGIQLAILASLFYSFGAVSDKAGVSQGVLTYTFYLCLTMTILLTLNILRKKYRGQLQVEWRLKRWEILLSSIVLLFSSFSFRYGLEISKASYASSVRQVSIIFGVLMGVFLLKEGYGKIRVIASLLIILGTILIKIAR